MKKSLFILILAAVLFIGGIVLHTGLIAVASGEGSLSDQAQAICSACHGG